MLNLTQPTILLTTFQVCS